MWGLSPLGRPVEQRCASWRGFRARARKSLLDEQDGRTAYGEGFGTERERLAPPPLPLAVRGALRPIEQLARPALHRPTNTVR